MSTATMITHERQRADALRAWQGHFDEQIFRKIGMRAPEPRADQSVLNYRQETDRMLKRMCLPQDHQYYKVQWRGIEDAVVLDNLERDLFSVCEKEFNNPANIPPGKIRMIPRMDGYGKIQFFDAIGRESFVKQMGRPGRRVASFLTSNGPVDASGRFLR